MEDLKKLARAGNDVPNSERRLAACTLCRLILSKEQWGTYRKNLRLCPNGCGEGKYPETTEDFTGVMSIMAPSRSWVAQWNFKKDFVPGLYAMHINSEQQDEDEERNEEDEGFVDDEVPENNEASEVMARASRKNLGKRKVTER